LGEPDCHHFVTIGGGFWPLWALSSGVVEGKVSGKFAAYRTPPTRPAGLKILVSFCAPAGAHRVEKLR
jgi:hypothetical protein